MLPDGVSNPGSLTYESGALPIALRGPAWGPCIAAIAGIYLLIVECPKYSQKENKDIL